MCDAGEMLARLREEAKAGRDPTAADETLALLTQTAEKLAAKRILEIGTGTGLTAIALALRSCARITAVECDAARAAAARQNFAAFGVESRIFLIEDDAANVLSALEEDGAFDLIFLDGPKAQYVKYYADCKRLLRRGGYLFSDDILLFGYVTGEPPKKRKMLAEHLREYLRVLQSDAEMETAIYEYGEGLAVSRKK